VAASRQGGARYHGLDIAMVPVGMMTHRLRQASLPGTAQQGSILDAQFQDASFDYIISVGCLHYTGDMGRAIKQCHRLLRSGGSSLPWCITPILIVDSIKQERKRSATPRGSYLVTEALSD
jgi:SAM-dependent methyltransferase